MYDILGNKKEGERQTKNSGPSGVTLNAVLPIIGVQNKARFSFKKS
jgi:hypothetical protein